MKYVIFSDSHNYINNAVDVLENFKNEIDGFMHLGDMCYDADKLHELFPDLKFYSICGNNERGEKAPKQRVAFVGGKKIVLVHGHEQRVYYSLMYLDYFARENEADVVLFGHTHTPQLEFCGQTALFNPGSISQPRSTYEPTFGVMSVENGEISFEHYLFKGKGSYEKIKIKNF